MKNWRKNMEWFFIRQALDALGEVKIKLPCKFIYYLGDSHILHLVELL